MKKLTDKRLFNRFVLGVLLLSIYSCIPKSPSKKVCPADTVFNEKTNVCIQSKNATSSPFLSNPKPLTKNQAVSSSDNLFYSITSVTIGSAEIEYIWYLDGFIINRGPSLISINFSPALAPPPISGPLSISPAVHSIKVELRDVSSGALYDAHTWSLEVLSPVSLKKITDTIPPNGSAIVGKDFSKITQLGEWKVGVSDLSTVGLLEVHVNDHTGLIIEYSLDGASLGQILFPVTRIARITDLSPNFHINLINPSLQENHVITAKVTDSATSVVIGEKSWNITVNPLPLTQVLSTAPARDTTITIEDLDYAPASFNPTVTINSAVSGGGSGSDFSKATGVPSGLTYQYLLNGVAITGYYTTTSNGPISLGDILSPSSYQILLSDANTTETKTLTLKVSDTYSSKLIDTINWNLKITPTTKPLPVIPLYPVVAATAPPTVQIENSPPTGMNMVVVNGFSSDLASFGLYFWVEAPLGGPNRNLLPSMTIDRREGNNSNGVTFEYYLDGVQIGTSFTTASINPIGSGSYKYTLNDANGGPYTFNLNVSTISESHTLTGKIIDNYSGNNIKTYTWPITVRPTNLPPIITLFNPASSTVTLVQDITQDFTIILDDPEVPLVSSPLNSFFSITPPGLAESNIAGGAFPPAATTPLMPNCAALSGEGTFTCSGLTFPSYGNDGPIAPGLYKIKITSTDSGGFESEAPISAPSPAQISYVWDVTITEENTLPVTVHAEPAGAGPAAPGVESHIENTNVAPVGNFVKTMTEGDSITFKVLFEEPQRDSVEIRVIAKVAGQADNTITPFTTFLKTDDNLQNTADIAFTVPENLLDTDLVAAASSAITFEITVNDKPHVATANGAATTLNAVITNRNPNPVATLTSPVSPLTNAVLDIFEGQPLLFTVPAANITDASSVTEDANGAAVIYQWQVDSDCGGANPYKNIIGANGDFAAADVTLNWTPHHSQVGANSCFRVCLGDKGFGNPADCSVAGTFFEWTGAANDFTTVRDESIDIKALAGTPTLIASWDNVAETTLTKEVYTVAAYTGQFAIYKSSYTATGLTVQANTGLIDSDANNAADLQDTIENLSITGDATNVWVAYKIVDTNATAAAPDVRVRCFIRTTLLPCAAQGQMDQNDIGIFHLGNIVLSNGYWFIPLIDTGNSNSISLITRDATLLTDTTGGMYFTLNSASFGAGIEVHALPRGAGGIIGLGMKSMATGDISIYGLDVTAPIAGGESPTATSFTNIFSTNISNPRFAINSNDNFYITGVNGANVFVSRVITSLTDLTSQGNNSFALATTPQYVDLIPSTTADETFILPTNTLGQSLLGHINMTAGTLKEGTKVINDIGNITSPSLQKTSVASFNPTLYSLNGVDRDNTFFTYLSNTGGIEQILLDLSVITTSYNAVDPSAPLSWDIPYILGP